MIQWAMPKMLYLLFAVPVVAVLMAAGTWLKRRSLGRLADATLVPRLIDSRSPRWAAVKAICLLLGLSFLILAAARPQWGEKLQVYKGRGIDIVIALDASKSMLATDVAPSRLARAKTQIASLLDNLSTNRVGIVAFAGDAQVMCPLTPDVEAAKLFLDIISPDNMPVPGTNIEHAVDAAASLFDPTTRSYKALVLVTDGDNLDGDPAVATKTAIDNGIRIFAVGVGTPEGSTIPESSGSGTVYMKDKDDKIVVSRLAERTLLVMAKATNGRYFRSQTINLDQLATALDQMEKKAIAGGDYVAYEEHYQAFLLIAFVLMFAGVLISDRRGAWLAGFALRRRAARQAGTAPPPAGPVPPHATTAVLAFALLGALTAPGHADVGSSMRKGNRLERQGKYDEALKAYQEAQVLEPDDIRIHYNIGRVLYEQNKHTEASEQFQLGLLAKKKPLRARSLYNLGNTQFKQQRLDEAIASYTQALLLQPDDLEAKQNLEYCLKLKAEQKQQQKPDSTRQQQQQQKQQQQQQQEQQRQQPRQAQARPGEGAISPEQANRMLQALQNKEKENLENRPKPPQKQPSSGKDW